MIVMYTVWAVWQNRAMCINDALLKKQNLKQTKNPTNSPHGGTCVPHPEPPSHLPPHPIPLGHPSEAQIIKKNK